MPDTPIGRRFSRTRGVPALAETLNAPVVVVGGGGHAKVVLDTLLLQGIDIVGISDPALNPLHEEMLGIPSIGGDEAILQLSSDRVWLVNGIGSIASTENRRRIFESFSERGYRFASVIHPSAVISRDAHLEEGVHVMAGATIQPGARIGRNVIVNTRASVDHDCDIGDHVHIAPGATLSGGVTVGEGTHIGTGAATIQSVRIGRGCIVGAGAVVLRDVADGMTIVGAHSRIGQR